MIEFKYCTLTIHRNNENLIMNSNIDGQLGNSDQNMWIKEFFLIILVQKYLKINIMVILQKLPIANMNNYTLKPYVKYLQNYWYTWGSCTNWACVRRHFTLNPPYALSTDRLLSYPHFWSAHHLIKNSITVFEINKICSPTKMSLKWPNPTSEFSYCWRLRSYQPLFKVDKKVRKYLHLHIL